MKSRIVYLALCGFMAINAMACASVKSSVKAGEEPQRIKDISVTDHPDRTEIVVSGEKPLIYTTFRLTDPNRLIVDLTGTTFGQFKETIEVNKEGLRNIVPVEGEKPSYIARLEISLTEVVESRVHTEGDKLIIDIEKPTTIEGVVSESITPPETSETAEAAPIPPVAPLAIEEQPPPLPEEEVPAAKTISKVTVEPNEKEITVTILGDGGLKPQVSMMEGDRLVVDLPEVTSTVTPNTIMVKHPVLKRVRIGQHLKPQKVRVVLDLARPVMYDVQAADHQVRLIVRTTAEPPTTAFAPKATPSVSRPEAPKPTVSPTPAAIGGQPEGLVTAKKYTGRKVSLDFQDADLDNVLRLLADVSGLNIVIGTEVKGKVTIKLINVPWDQALDIILKMNNLGQIREGNIIRIAALANIARQQAEEAAAKEAKVKAEDLVTRILPVNYAKAEDLAEPLRKNLSPRGDITIDKRTNTMIIKDVERHLQDILSLAKTLDAQTPQVQIEARIVQADTSFAQSLGIMWGAAFTQLQGNNVFGIQGGTSGDFNAPTPGFAVNLPATVSGLSSVPGAGFTFGRFTDKPLNLDLRLSAGELSGLTKTISSPKVITLDNKEAKIEQGESIPFQTTSLQGTQTTFVDANLTLQVTPHVTSDGSIIMKVKAAKNQLGSFSGPAGPSIEKREATTEILLKDGETTVIGGIFTDEKRESKAALPWLSKIPILGWLFKSVSETDTKKELLIFITPTIIKT